MRLTITAAAALLLAAPACTTTIIYQEASDDTSSSGDVDASTGDDDSTGRNADASGDESGDDMSSSAASSSETTDEAASSGESSDDSDTTAAPLLALGEQCDDAAACESGACVRGTCAGACDLDEPATCGAYEVCLPAPGGPGCIDTGNDGDASVIAGTACTPDPNPAANMSGDLDVYRFDSAAGVYSLTLWSADMTLTIIDDTGAVVTAGQPQNLGGGDIETWRYTFATTGRVWIIAEAGELDEAAIYYFCSQIIA